MTVNIITIVEAVGNRLNNNEVAISSMTMNSFIYRPFGNNVDVTSFVQL